MLSIFGKITNPLTTIKSGYGGIDGSGGSGPKDLLSNVIQVVVIFGSMYTLLNIVVAGFQYISSQGDSGKAGEARSKIYNSFIGLAIIALVYVIAEVISQLIFGSKDAIFQPQIVGPGTI